jgi:hypothetical protein
MWKIRQKPVLPKVHTYNVSNNDIANPKFLIHVPLIKAIHLRGIIMKQKPCSDYNNFYQNLENIEKNMMNCREAFSMSFIQKTYVLDNPWKVFYVYVITAVDKLYIVYGKNIN